MDNCTSQANLNEGIDIFLDAVDEVLNSNTFLLRIPIENAPANLNYFLSSFVRRLPTRKVFPSVRNIKYYFIGMAILLAMIFR